MKCTICGHESRAGSTACPRCGGPLLDSVSAWEVDQKTVMRPKLVVDASPAEPSQPPAPPDDPTVFRPATQPVGTPQWSEVPARPGAPFPSDAPAVQAGLDAYALAPAIAPDPGPAPAQYPGPGAGPTGGWPAAPPQIVASPTPPASVRRIKALSFAVAAIGLVSMITAIVMNSGAGFQTVAGIVGIVLYVALAFQVQARKNWARVVIGVLAILGFLGNLLSVVSTLGVLAILQEMIGSSYVVPIVFGLILVLASEVILIALVVNAFHRDTASWCAPAPLPPA